MNWQKFIKLAVAFMLLVSFVTCSILLLNHEADPEILHAVIAGYIALEIVWLFTPLWLASLASPFLILDVLATLVLPPEMQIGMQLFIVVCAVLLALPIGKPR